MSGRRAKLLRRQTPASACWLRGDRADLRAAWLWRVIVAAPPGWRRQIGRLLRAGLRSPR